MNLKVYLYNDKGLEIINRIDGKAKGIVTKLLKGNFVEKDFTEENCEALSL